VVETVTITPSALAATASRRCRRRAFVPFTLPGETVEIDRAGIAASFARHHRQPRPLCAGLAHFGSLRRLQRPAHGPPAYLRLETRGQWSLAGLHGVDAEVEPIVPSPQTRRAVFSVSTRRPRVLGFNRGNG
jgi:hypothetical protein